MIICDLCGIKIVPQEASRIEPTTDFHYCEICAKRHSDAVNTVIEWRRIVLYKLDKLFKKKYLEATEKLKRKDI